MHKYFMSTVYARPGEGSEALDMVMDNLGMDDTLNNPGEDTSDQDDYASENDDERVSHTENEDDADDLEPQPRRNQRQEPDQRQARQPNQQQPQQRPVPRNAEVKPDAKGNLVDATGKVIAKAGFEARMYQDLHKSRGELVRAQAQKTEAEGRVARAVEIGQGLHTENVQLKERIANLSGTKFGLNDGEQIQAMQLAQKAKTDPAAAIKEMLTMAAARGVDLTKIGIAPGGVDTAAMMNLLRQEIQSQMAPLQQRTQQENQQRQTEQQQREANAQVEREVVDFFNANEDAKPHADIFVKVLERYPKMTLGEVWARLQLNMIQNANPRDQNSQLARRNQNPVARRNLPAGRSAPATNNSSGMAQPNVPYDEILRDVLAETGYSQ